MFGNFFVRVVASFSSTLNWDSVCVIASRLVTVLITDDSLIKRIFSSGSRNAKVSAQVTPAIPPPTITKVASIMF